MKRKFYTLVLILSMFIVLFGCAPDAAPPGSNTTKPGTADFTGGVFKGPFLVGSTVTIYELDASLNQTGVSYSGDIVSDDGIYDISGVPLSGPVELVADGYYFDEISGQVTNQKMTMRTITAQTGTVNINLFTALEYDRVKALYAAGQTITDAKKQAVTELFAAFGLSAYQDNSGAIAIDSQNGAALLAVSSLFAYKRSPAQVQSLITELRVDFADGTINVSKLTDNAKYIMPDSVRTNLQNYFNSKNISLTVPSISDELWSLYETDTLTPDAENMVKLTSPDVVNLAAGFGHIDGFIVPAGHVVSFTINVPADMNLIRFYTASEGRSFTVSDMHTATATGPGYFRLDFGVAYPDTPYDFSITVNDNGTENTVNYRVTGGAAL